MASPSTSADHRYADLVLAGGGVLGIGHIGAISVFEDHGYVFRRVAGTSVGSVIGSLVAAGRSATQIHELMRQVDLDRFAGRSGYRRIPLVGPLLSSAVAGGAYDTDYVRERLGNMLADCGVTTFGDLRFEEFDPLADSARDCDHQYKFVAHTADLERGELIRLPWDYRRCYGVEPDDQLVVDAVQASMSVPYFFLPKRIDYGPQTKATFVDGFVLSNFPIDVFDLPPGVQPRWPTFGVNLLPHLPSDSARLFPWLGLLDRLPPFRFLQDLVLTTIFGHDQTDLDRPEVAARTFEVPSNGIDPLDFDISQRDQDRLWQNGRHAAATFLEGFDFAEYLRRYRSCATPRPSTSQGRSAQSGPTARQPGRSSRGSARGEGRSQAR